MYAVPLLDIEMYAGTFIRLVVLQKFVFLVERFFFLKKLALFIINLSSGFASNIANQKARSKNKKTSVKSGLEKLVKYAQMYLFLKVCKNLSLELWRCVC